MANGLHLQIVTPRGPVVDAQVSSLSAPGSFGEFQARPGHQAYLVRLCPGILHFDLDGKTRWYALSGGTAEVRHDSVTVLADACEAGDDVDEARAKAASDRARELLKSKESHVDHERARASLERAAARMQVAGR